MFESLRLNMNRLKYESWVRAHQPALGGPLSCSLALMSPDRETGEEILKYDNRKAVKNFRESKRRLNVSVLLRFSDADHNYV